MEDGVFMAKMCLFNSLISELTCSHCGEKSLSISKSCEVRRIVYGIKLHCRKCKVLKEVLLNTEVKAETECMDCFPHYDEKGTREESNMCTKCWTLYSSFFKFTYILLEDDIISLSTMIKRLREEIKRKKNAKIVIEERKFNDQAVTCQESSKTNQEVSQCSVVIQNEAEKLQLVCRDISNQVDLTSVELGTQIITLQDKIARGQAQTKRSLSKQPMLPLTTENPKKRIKINNENPPILATASSLLSKAFVFAKSEPVSFSNSFSASYGTDYVEFINKNDIPFVIKRPDVFRLVKVENSSELPNSHTEDIKDDLNSNMVAVSVDTAAHPLAHIKIEDDIKIEIKEESVEYEDPVSKHTDNSSKLTVDNSGTVLQQPMPPKHVAYGKVIQTTPGIVKNAAGKQVVKGVLPAQQMVTVESPLAGQGKWPPLKSSGMTSVVGGRLGGRNIIQQEGGLVISQVVSRQKNKPWENGDYHQQQCFCRRLGFWYNRMLECQRCKHWFHETCIGCLQYKLICGDRFYLYVCELCNNGREFLHRLPIDWENIVHLAIWNLSKSKISNSKNGIYYDYEEQITLWVNHYWELLQCPPELQSIPIKDRTQCILLALKGNSNKFKCGKEVRKKKSIWKLRSTDPPSVLEIILPPESPITETLMHRVRYCERTTELCPIPKSFKIDTA